MPLRRSFTQGLLLGATAFMLSVSGAYAQKVIISETGDKTEVVEGGATDTYTINLETQPAASVTITLSFDSAQLATDKPNLTFTTANWANAQTVTVSAVNDAVEEEQIITRNISHAASHGETVRDVVVSIVDNDIVKPDVLITESGGKTEVLEGGTGDAYALKLSKAPDANVTVTLGVDTTELTVAPTSFTFTVANWANAQTVTVSAIDDADVEGLEVSPITHTAASDDPDFGSVFVQPVFVSIIDNDSQKSAVGVAETGDNTEVAEGGKTDTYLMALSTQPAANVVISLSFNSAQVSASTNTLTFTPANWNISQSITLIAVNDYVDEGLHIEAIDHTAASADPDYNLIYVPSIIVTILDNDKSGVRITESGGNTSVTEGGAGDTYAVVLDTKPLSNVTVRLTVPTAQLSTDKTNVTFTSANWSNAQTVAVTAVDDFTDEGAHLGLITHTVTSGDPLYDGILAAAVVVFITDNDLTTYAEIVGISNVTSTIRVQFNTESNHYYRAEHCSNLVTVATWNLLTNNIRGYGNALEVSDQTSGNIRFYRVRARPSLWP
jgi:hypothetical protein